MGEGDTWDEANWNRQTGGQTDRRTGGQDPALSQADALTKNCFVSSSSHSEFLNNTFFIIGFDQTLPPLLHPLSFVLPS